MTKREVVVSGQERVDFRAGWDKAKAILAASIFSARIPEGAEKILEDWYKIRSLYVREGNVEQFVTQQKAFNREYDRLLDDQELIMAVGVITSILNRDI